MWVDKKCPGHNLLSENLSTFKLLLSFFLQSRMLQIVCSDSSDPSTFQCICGRTFWNGQHLHVVFSCVCGMSLNLLPFSVIFSLGSKSKSQSAKCGG